MMIIGPRVLIRPTRREDIPFLVQLWNNGEVMGYLGHPGGMGVNEKGVERWWLSTPQASIPEEQLSIFDAPDCIIALLDGNPIGELNYGLDSQQRARVGMKMLPAYWTHSYAQEALSLLIRDLFATTKIHTILAEPSLEHKAARETLARLGFEPSPTENHPNRWTCSRADFAHRMVTEG